MRKTIWIALILILLVLPLVSSYKRGEVFNLKVPFEVNGSVPTSVAWCNISIDYPNGTYLKRNISMTNLNNGDFNITLSSTDTYTIGDYDWKAFCCDGAFCAAGYGSFKMTPSGVDEINSGESLILFLSIFSIIVIAVLFFIASFKVQSFPVKLIFMGLSLTFFIVVLLFTMVTLGQILGGWETLVESYSTFFWVALFLFFLVFLFLMLCLFKRAVELLKAQKGLA